MKALKFGGIALVLAAATAYAFDGVVLKYVFKKDSVSKTRLKGTFDFQGTEVAVEMVNQSKVKDVADDGTVTLEEGLVEGKATVAGQEISLEAQPANVIVMKASGELKEIRGDNVDEKAYRMQNLMAFVPPAEAVTIGSKWTREVAANKDTKAPAFKATYNVVGDEKVSGTETLKIEYKINETEGSDPASVEGTVWVSKADCSIWKGNVKWNNMPVPQAPAPMSGSVTIERIN